MLMARRKADLSSLPTMFVAPSIPMFDPARTVLHYRLTARGSAVHSPVLNVYGPSGQPAFVAEVKGPAGAQVVMTDTAAGDRGRVVVSMKFADRYIPLHECFGGNGSVWAVGWQRAAATRSGTE